METIDDPPLQGWFDRTRGAVGVRIVGLREARRELLAALRAGTPVGLVGDRDLTGGGLAGPRSSAHPAPLPLGPAMLAVESGAPAYVVGVRRSGVGRYRGRLAAVTSRRRGRAASGSTATMTALARRRSSGSSRTPPSSGGRVFFPIWPDLEEVA